MNQQLHRVSTMALAAAIAILVGCGSTPQQPTVTLPDPQTVPREQWSEALTVFDAMGLKGQRDVPKELVGHAQGQGAAANVTGGAGDLVAGPSVGLGLGMFLLGGGGSPAEGLPQIAAWVPARLAGSPEEATALAVKSWEAARKAALGTEPKQLQTITAKYPYGWNPRVAFANTKDALLDIPVQITDGPKNGPAVLGMRDELIYGPIFIYPKQLSLDTGLDERAYVAHMRKISENLPNWFYLYYPGSKFNKQPVPAAVYHSGQTLTFVSK
ncbi:TPA: hypothetical protein ACPWFJ_003601 [Pseudomonas aeruginosa]